MLSTFGKLLANILNNSVLHIQPLFDFSLQVIKQFICNTVCKYYLTIYFINFRSVSNFPMTIGMFVTFLSN